MSYWPRCLFAALACSATALVLTSCGSTTNSQTGGNAGIPAGQSTTTNGPLLDAWWDSQAQGLRLIYGVPGAAVEGPAIDNDGTYAGGVACVRGRIAILMTNTGGLFLGALPQGLPASLSSEKMSKPQVAFSPSCGAALAFSSDGSRGMLLQGLPGSPTSKDLSFSTSITAAAVADDGSLLMASPGAGGTVVQFMAAGSTTPQPVTTLTKLGGFAFLSGSDSAILADAGANTVIRASQLAANVSLVSVAGPSDGLAHPSAIGTSADGRWAVVANQGSGTLVRIDLSGQSAATRTNCRCAPENLEPLAGNLAFRLNAPGTGIVWAYDGSASTPRVAFLPVAALSSVSAQGASR